MLSGLVLLLECILYIGDQILVLQVIDKIVMLVVDDFDFDDIILVFLLEFGLKLLYVMYCSFCNMFGIVSGKGQNVGNNWMGGVSIGDGVFVFFQIVDKLCGKIFGSFDFFCWVFWKVVVDDFVLSK